MYRNIWCCFCSNVSASAVPEGPSHPPEERPLAVELATDDNTPMRRWLIAGLDEVRIGIETLFISIFVKKIMIIVMSKMHTDSERSRV